MALELRRIDYSEDLFRPLLAEAESEGVAFLARLRDEWISGTLCFEAPGEILLGAFEGSLLIGVAGISRDTYALAPGLGRVRHVYVLKGNRGRGVARALMEQLIAYARSHFDRLRLSTERREASELYESLGFVPVTGPKQTHLLQL